MAGFITAEGLVVAAGADTYDYVNDQRRLAGSIRSISPAADRTAGDAIAAAMNTDGRPVSTTNPLVTYNQATRNIEWKDNVGWTAPILTNVIPSATVAIGSATGLATGITAGTIRPILQAGTFTATTDSSGYLSYVFPSAFPTGLITIVVANGDSSASGRGKVFSVSGNPPFTQTLSTLYVSVAAGDGTALASTSVRVNYFAIGW